MSCDNSDTAVVVLNKKNCSEANTVYVGRDYDGNGLLANEPGERGWLGNPFIEGEHGTREEVIEQFAVLFCRTMLDDDGFRQAVDSIDDDLAGWCAPKPCHGDVVATYLNEGLPAVVERWEL